MLSNFFAAVAREGSGARGGADNKLGDIEPARCSQPKISSFVIKKWATKNQTKEYEYWFTKDLQKNNIKPDK